MYQITYFFKPGTQKYVIGYNNGTTAEFTKTQLMKILSRGWACSVGSTNTTRNNKDKLKTPTIVGEAMAGRQATARAEG